jgi:hypothetical protein
LASPLFRYSAGRDAYILRIAGNRFGPVLKPDRRVHRSAGSFKGIERRSVSHRAVVRA